MDKILTIQVNPQLSVYYLLDSVTNQYSSNITTYQINELDECSEPEEVLIIINNYLNNQYNLYHQLSKFNKQMTPDSLPICLWSNDNITIHIDHTIENSPVNIAIKANQLAILENLDYSSLRINSDNGGEIYYFDYHN